MTAPVYDTLSDDEILACFDRSQDVNFRAAADGTVRIHPAPAQDDGPLRIHPAPRQGDGPVRIHPAPAVVPPLAAAALGANALGAAGLVAAAGGVGARAGAAAAAGAAPPAPFKFPHVQPPNPKDGLEPDVDYNRLLLPMQKNAHNVGEDQRGVEYLAEEERERYRVVIAATMTRGGAVFDTETIKSQYGIAAAQSLGAKPPADLQEWIDAALIWVCAVPPRKSSVAFYSHICHPGKTHHSSFTAGGDILAGGEWIVRQGKLLKISANSGHYQPTIDYLYRAVLHMSGARCAETTIMLWDSVGDEWVNVPWAKFIGAPSGGGRYWTHPNAALASA